MTHPTRADEPTYMVTLTIRATIPVSFVRITEAEDDDVITPSDAIENAIGAGIADGSYGHANDDRTVEGLLASLGFSVALPFDGEAVLD